MGMGNVKPGWGTPFEDFDYINLSSPKTSFSSGQAYWNIPWHYKVTTGGENSYLIQVLQQIHTIDSSGAVSISKGGSSYTSQLMDDTTTWGQKCNY